MNLDNRKSPEKKELESDYIDTNLPDFVNSKKHQEARAFLRERYLRAVTALVGHSCEFNLVDGTCVTGTFSGSDTESKRFYVKDLVTPIGAVSDALLRSEDIVHFRISGIHI